VQILYNIGFIMPFCSRIILSADIFNTQKYIIFSDKKFIIHTIFNFNFDNLFLKILSVNILSPHILLLLFIKLLLSFYLQTFCPRTIFYHNILLLSSYFRELCPATSQALHSSVIHKKFFFSYFPSLTTCWVWIPLSIYLLFVSNFSRLHRLAVSDKSQSFFSLFLISFHVKILWIAYIWVWLILLYL